MSETIFKVTGMDCAEETSALRKAVGALPGINDVKFNLLNGTMTVTSAEVAVDDADILAAVKRAGMNAHATDNTQAAIPQSVAEGFWPTHGRAVLCLGSGIAITAGFLSHWFLHGSILDAFVEGGRSATHIIPAVSIGFYLVAVIVGGWLIFPKAVAALRRFRADMNLLMTIAVLGAIVIGEWFEAATVTFLFSLSFVLEAWSISRARSAIKSLFTLTPPRARYICPHDGDIMESPIEDVPLGVTVLVRPGERIPLDGQITKGSAFINQAPITGESVPVEKHEGDEVFAGTINEDGAIEFQVTKPTSDTTISRIIRMVEEAQSRRSPSEQWVDKFARYYTPAMILLAIAIAVIPPLVYGGGWTQWFYESLVILVIACPCALVISTPVSIVAALASAARAGVLIKGGAFLEEAGRLKVIALDKTGTITHGRPEVQRIIPLNGHTEEELLDRAASLELHSSHPLARSIVRKAEQVGRTITPAENYREFKGRGAQGSINGRTFWVGSHRMLHEKQMENDELHGNIDALEDFGHSVVVVGNDDHVCGFISVADSLRDNARSIVADLKNAGVEKVLVLTGDNQGTARAISEKIGADEFHAELLPEDKLTAIEEAKRRYGTVAMVGDGINDAPALAAANIGIAMGAAGTDAAMETADIVLMSDDLSRLPWLIHHGRRALGVIRQNIGFALSIKVLFMGLALANIATLWMAIAADMGASLLVIMNALRLLNGKQG
ncbi:MAG: heavy metal translocating P-type ATPase [Deltaproteobacteria bacterium]